MLIISILANREFLFSKINVGSLECVNTSFFVLLILFLNGNLKRDTFYFHSEFQLFENSWIYCGIILKLHSQINSWQATKLSCSAAQYI